MATKKTEIYGTTQLIECWQRDLWNRSDKEEKRWNDKVKETYGTMEGECDRSTCCCQINQSSHPR